MTQARTILTDILSGSQAQSAQGFMLTLPRGYRLERLIEAVLQETYGSIQHPDIRRIAPEGAGDVIPVAAIRDIQTFLVSTPSAAPMKTLVIYRADRMNINAANALLKPLEEPNGHTRIILVSDAPSNLPPTIRSRCALYQIAADPALGAAELQDQAAELEISLSAKEAEAALSLADGDPWLAARIAQFDLGKWITQVSRWLSTGGPNVPLPPAAGKAAAPLGVSLRALQSLMVRASRGEVELAGWTLPRVLSAAWLAVERSDDIGRAGIDAKTRLHSILVGMKAT